jgi:hypothetical protein
MDYVAKTDCYNLPSSALGHKIIPSEPKLLAPPHTPHPTPDRCRFFTVRLGQDKEGKVDKRTRKENRTESCSVKLTSKSRNARFFVLTLPCLLVYLSPLSYLHPNLKKPTLMRHPTPHTLPILSASLSPLQVDTNGAYYANILALRNNGGSVFTKIYNY